MSARIPHGPPGVTWSLRQLARRRAEVEYCDLCTREIPASHEHLLDPVTRYLLCACHPCAVLFSETVGTNAKYKRVPRDTRALPHFRLTDAQWNSLRIPIELAFFYESSTRGHVVAMYPSPAGPMESLLRLDTWVDLVRENAPLARMTADVEALLVNRVGLARRSDPAEYYIVPIDECFRLVGLLRRHWKGLSGGTDVWREIGGFFDGLRQRAIYPREASHA